MEIFFQVLYTYNRWKEIGETQTWGRDNCRVNFRLEFLDYKHSISIFAASKKTSDSVQISRECPNFAQPAGNRT